MITPRTQGGPLSPQLGHSKKSLWYLALEQTVFSKQATKSPDIASHKIPLK